MPRRGVRPPGTEARQPGGPEGALAPLQVGHISWADSREEVNEEAEEDVAEYERSWGEDYGYDGYDGYDGYNGGGPK